MPICKQNLKKAIIMIGPEHARLLVRFAQDQDKLENKWQFNIKKHIKKIDEYVAQHLFRYGRVPEDIDFSEIIMEMYYQSAKQAFKTSQEELKFLRDDKIKMAKPPAIKTPKSFNKLQEIYDVFKRTGDMPKRQQTFAEKIKKAYIKKAQNVWKKWSESFREGQIANQEEVVKKIREAGDKIASRAQTIARTETTNYYNNVRREVFDKSNVVTHYLFLAIRDQATTKWCSDKVFEGKRGRHGLVYKKDDPITDKETPACHWNCRSEMVPLTPFNPRHKKLIEDEEVQRRNNHCHPLPKGWD